MHWEDDQDDDDDDHDSSMTTGEWRPPPVVLRAPADGGGMGLTRAAVVPPAAPVPLPKLEVKRNGLWYQGQAISTTQLSQWLTRPQAAPVDWKTTFVPLAVSSLPPPPPALPKPPILLAPAAHIPTTPATTNARDATLQAELDMVDEGMFVNPELQSSHRRKQKQQLSAAAKAELKKAAQDLRRAQRKRQSEEKRQLRQQTKARLRAQQRAEAKPPVPPDRAWMEYCCLAPWEQLSFVRFQQLWTAAALDAQGQFVRTALLSAVRMRRWNVVHWLAFHRPPLPLMDILGQKMNPRARVELLRLLGSVRTWSLMVQSFVRVVAEWFQRRARILKGAIWTQELQRMGHSLFPAHAVHLCFTQLEQPVRKAGWQDHWLFYTLEYGTADDTQCAIAHGYHPSPEALTYVFWRPDKHDHMDTPTLPRPLFTTLQMLSVLLLRRKQTVQRFLQGRHVQSTPAFGFRLAHLQSWLSILFSRCNWFMPLSTSALLAMNASFLIHPTLLPDPARSNAKYLLWHTRMARDWTLHVTLTDNADRFELWVHVPVEWDMVHGQRTDGAQEKCLLQLPAQVGDLKTWVAQWQTFIHTAFHDASAELRRLLQVTMREVHGLFPETLARVVAEYCF